ncbi:MAG: tetratricopeptide repeat protein [Rhodospirillaceae bacterium]|nr:tetratricopeptide repeat protein [Rhodospirillaceae bacterium]
MADIFTEVDEAVRQDKAKALWKRYGWLFGLVAIVVVGGTAAYTIYKEWQISSARSETGAILTALSAAETAPVDAADALMAFSDDAAEGRAAVARTLASGLYSTGDDGDAAQATAIELASDGAPGALGPLSRIQAALAAVDSREPDEVEAMLAPLADDQVWAPQVSEVRALLALRAGDTATAASIYASLADNPAAPPALRTRADQLQRTLAQ